MKRMIAVLLAASLAATLGGCARDGQETADPRISVVATIFPQYDFVRQIAGDNVRLTMLLPAGADSHSYEPTPADIIAISGCDLLICVGGATDFWAEAALESAESAVVIRLTDVVDVVQEELVEGMQEHEGEDEGVVEYDEHVWTSPPNAMAIVSAIAGALCKLDRANAETYRDNADEYLKELVKLDSEFSAAVDGAARRTVLFADRFPFRYLADAYGLSYFAAFPGCAAEGDASPATVAFLIDKVVQENLPAVFYIEFSNQRMADAICESAGCEKLLLHSCHSVSREDLDAGATYIGIMRENLINLKRALN